jgi:predicted Rossmann fold flavoprotein
LGNRVVVIGGGPAGLMAAGRAAQCGAQVLLIEKTPRLGNKLRMTGGGHGNVGHSGTPQELEQHLGPAGDFLLPALCAFGTQELAAFFQNQGLPLKAATDGRLYPATRNAHSVLTCLKAWCLAGGVGFRYRSQVHNLIAASGAVSAVEVGDHALTAGAVVLATGGASFPSTGSTGDGYRLAQALGHAVIPPAPGLVPLISAADWIVSVAGVSLRDVGLVASQKGRTLARTQGDLLFTPKGLSGPAALNLSSHISRQFAGGAIDLAIDLLPGLLPEELAAQLTDTFVKSGARQLITVLRQWLPSSLCHLVARLAGVDPALRVAQIGAAQRRDMVALLKGLPVRLVGTEPLEDAMVTCGGIALDEIDALTMGSKRVRGLFFAGEVLDIAGDSGGYNLHAAWATGHLAGESAAAYVREVV